MSLFIKNLNIINNKIQVSTKKFMTTKTTADFLELQSLEVDRDILIQNYDLPF